MVALLFMSDDEEEKEKWRKFLVSGIDLKAQLKQLMRDQFLYGPGKERSPDSYEEDEEEDEEDGK